MTFYGLRNKKNCIQQSEGLSLARPVGINRSNEDRFFNILTNICNNYECYTKSGYIFNMDETGCHLNKEPGKVLGMTEFNSLRAEKVETISVIACCML